MAWLRAVLLCLTLGMAAACHAQTPAPFEAYQADGEIFIRIFKQEASLEVWQRPNGADQFSLRKTYPICAFSGAPGPKLQEGDGQAPEGFYTVKPASLNPNSSYHLSFNLGFPNAYDRANGRTGSYLMVHGNCVSIGCYAMTDAGIEEIYGLVASALGQGQPAVAVHIFPFQMTATNMALNASNEWAGFWAMLKIGYDRFEATRLPPKVGVSETSYTFAPGQK